MSESLQLALGRASGLRRFVKAQDAVIDQLVHDLVDGRKQTCWMWFVFPQAKGLGTSYNSRLYALSRREASRYLRHWLLGGRLRETTRLVLEHMRAGRSAVEIFGELDALKFRSSMDLFASVASGQDWALFKSAAQWTYHEEHGETFDASSIEADPMQFQRRENERRGVVGQPHPDWKPGDGLSWKPK